jgi:hypothetical protein
MRIVKINKLGGKTMRKSTIFSIIVGIIIGLVSVNLYCMIIGNDSCRGYEGGCKSNDPGDLVGVKSTDSSICQLLIKGGGYFLKSHSDLLLFLNKIELSELKGMDYFELKNIINSAIENMEYANETYINLISIAKITPYNPYVIEKLQLFDYPGFKEENKLNSEIFIQVEAYLSKGDITGSYIHLNSYMDSILDKLDKIKLNIYSNTFPEITELWSINQKYAETMLFGQYLAQVFIETK